MIKIQEIISDYSAMPLAQIRTDGNKVDWIDDGEKMGEVAGDDYESLLSFIQSHSHLTLRDNENPVAIRHLTLSNKDTVSITDDGKTAFLNGKLLTIAQKDNLQAMLDSGALSVSGQGAPQIIQATKPKPKPVAEPQKDGYADYFAQNKPVEEDDEEASVYYDPALEKIESTLGKNMAYYAKYKKFKGGLDA